MSSSIIRMVLIIPSSVLMALMMITTNLKGSEAEAEGGARALYVFGDSLVDSGNNNYLPTTARADSPPYGIDYPTHRPTGRFSNGFLLPDLISKLIGSEPTLPYLSPELRGKKLLVGANFASAGAGILNDTGIQFVGILRMFQQFKLFQEYQKRLSREVGAEKAEEIVKGALVLMTLGGNDFVNNYFLTPTSARSLQFTIPEFCFYLISEYKKILMRLYELGARRVLVTGTGPLGCIPSQLAARSKNGECVAEVQEAAMIFNPLLIEMTTELNIKYGSLVFIAINAFQMKMDIIMDPQRFGFVTSKIACCGQGRFNGLGICNPFFSSLCPNRDEYVFWDAFHPTQRAWGFIVQNIFNGTIHYMNPMNLSTIMAIDSKI